MEICIQIETPNSNPAQETGNLSKKIQVPNKHQVCIVVLRPYVKQVEMNAMRNSSVETRMRQILDQFIPSRSTRDFALGQHPSSSELGLWYKRSKSHQRR